MAGINRSGKYCYLPERCLGNKLVLDQYPLTGSCFAIYL
jgi:hypothetical protein